jgi:anti-sigma factor RsiW
MNAPDPQLLAAYFDGELEGRDDVAELRARVEAWLETHPEARQQGTEQQQLQKLWLDTTPADPSTAAWAECRKAIDAARAQAGSTPATRRPWLLFAAVAGVALFVGALIGVWQFTRDVEHHHVVQRPHEEPVEVFEVAQSHEITILRVEGADTESLVVGIPPLVGLMELADPGDVRVLRVHPAALDKMIANVSEQPRPIVWAQVDED